MIGVNVYWWTSLRTTLPTTCSSSIRSICPAPHRRPQRTSFNRQMMEIFTDIS